MLTPVEIKNKTFKSGVSGYDKKEVDSYMKDIVRSYEEMYRENMELKDKISSLNDGLSTYKSMEKTLSRALVLAEQTATETKETANKEAKRIEKEAKVKAGIIIADAKNDLEGIHRQTLALIQQYEKYKAQFGALAKAQMDLLNTDAFNINVANLDAFISGQVPLQENYEFNINSLFGENTAAANSDEVTEITSDEKAEEEIEVDSEYLNFDVEGQEEFDILDLTDDED